MSTTYGWTQPICEDCWYERNPERRPMVLIEATRELERCVHCGISTKSGIYVRVDPKTARYPSLTS